MRRFTWLHGLLIFAVLLSLPPFFFGFPTVTAASGHDVLLVIRWIINFNAQFWQGDLYPRWLTAGNSGFGEPSFYFYPPLPFWLTTLTLGPSGNWVWPSTALAIGFLIGRMVAACGCYRWLRYHLPAQWATIGAAAFIAAPFTLTMAVYVRTSYAETMGIALLPWVLCGIDAVLERRRHGFTQLAVATALLAFCHLPLTMLAGLVAGLYALVRGWRHPRQVAWALAAGVLGLALAAIYILPALQLQPLARLETIHEGTFVATNWFLDSVYFRLQRKHMVAYIGLQLLVFVLAVAVLWLRRRIDAAVIWSACIVASLVTLVMMTSLTAPIWGAGSPLSRVQFPWRLMGLESLLLAGLLAVACAAAPRRLAACCATLVIGTSLLPFAWTLYDDKFLRGPAQLLAVREEYNLSEYVTASWTGPLEFKKISRDPAPPPRLEPPGAGVVEGLAWSGGEGTATIHLTAPALLVVPQQAWPAWRAVDGEGAPLQIDTAPPMGLLRIAVPAATATVRILRDKLPAERHGLWLSLAALALLAGVSLAEVRRRG
jgi:hypothetical protein